MDPVLTIPQDEIKLGELVCLKLSRVLQGTMSLGLAACLAGKPEPLPFLKERNENIGALLIVLGSVTGGPSSVKVLRLLRELSLQLSVLAIEFAGNFQRLVNWKDVSPVEAKATAQALLVAYRKFLVGIEEFLRIIGSEHSLGAQANLGSKMVEEFLFGTQSPIEAAVPVKG